MCLRRRYAKIPAVFLIVISRDGLILSCPLALLVQDTPYDPLPSWSQTALVYQIHPWRFQDSIGDGIGDIPRISSRLDYLNEGTPDSLRVDAIWLSPIYQSPLRDFSYDVTDYCDIDPRFGIHDGRLRDRNLRDPYTKRYWPYSCRRMRIHASGVPPSASNI
jgi:hypothetical protein